jgi:cellulose synthase/poly-beta-1,6-N-acetylglucosamine synthase-like glycosyltransferase
MTILPGMGTMFRATALKGLGGYDMGLGDDTDLTLRLRKARWRLKFSLKARISTDVPVTLGHLMRQRSRWTRNMVKMRLRKHRDMGSFRYGWVNALLFYENVLNRTIHPLTIAGSLIYTHFSLGAEAPMVIGGLYWYSTFALYAKCLVARDLTGTPGITQFLMAPLYLFYRAPLLLNQVIQVPREVLHIKTWHPYVPRRIWDSIPHH